MNAASWEKTQKKAECIGKGKCLFEFLQDYTVVDLETTGLDPRRNNIIEIAAIRVEDSVVVRKFSSLVNPFCRIDGFITQLTGITNAMLSTAPAIEDVLPAFLDFVGDSIIVGHNVPFDINFLYNNCILNVHQPFRNDFVDTMRFSRKMFPQHNHHRLCDLIERFEIGSGVEHRALSDVIQTHQCYEYMKKFAAANNISLMSLCGTTKATSAKDIVF